MKLDPMVEKYRLHHQYLDSNPGDLYGIFLIPGPCGVELKVMACDADAHAEVFWEHVSISTRNRCPNWQEMCFIKDLFWDPEETVIQLHPPKSKWINMHPFCLHLWKPTTIEIPLPPPNVV